MGVVIIIVRILFLFRVSYCVNEYIVDKYGLDLFQELNIIRKSEF